MLKKVISKLKKVTSKPEAPTPKPSPKTEPAPRLLTAEGWKRLMMKKYRKSS